MKRLLILLLVTLCAQTGAWALVPPSWPEAPPVEGYPPAQTPSGPPVSVTHGGSIGAFLICPNDSTGTVENKVVTAGFAEGPNHFFYIEDPDRAAGIRVDIGSAANVVVGDRVTVTGTIGVTNGERRISATDVDIVGHTSAPSPLAMDNPTVGGYALDNTPGITGAIGPYNKGLLVMTWGKVTARDESAGWFYIDDGSHLADGSGNIGVKVLAGSSWVPTGNPYVVVTGISSSYQLAGNDCRLIRTRTSADVVTDPTMATISSPAGLLDLQEGYGGPWFASVGLPGVPVNPDPAAVFFGAKDAMPSGVLDGNLSWFDPTGDQNTWPYPYVYYDGYVRDSAGLPQPHIFGPIYSGRGYWLKMGERGATISYQAITSPIQSTDRYIALPRQHMTFIGNPFNDTVMWQSMLVTDGKTVISLLDAWREEYNYNWLCPVSFWWDCLTQSQCTLEGVLWWASDPDTQYCMKPWQGYWTYSYMDRLALIVPAGGEESLSVTANPPAVGSSGSTQITAKALLRSGRPMEFAAVTFSTTAGTLSGPTPNDGLTDKNGEVKVTLSGLQTGSATVTASTPYGCPPPPAASCTVGIDTSAPSTPIVTDDGDFTTSTSTLHARWSVAADPESGISGYQYAIGTTQGGTQVLNWTQTTDLEATATGLSLDSTGSATYYFAVKAINGAGMPSDSAGVSDGITCQPQKVIHVKPTGSDSNSGLSWALAKATVQAAIDTAGSTKEVWVAAGTYQPDERITLASGSALYGGFAGTESVRIHRNWKDHPTILDGSRHAYSVVTCQSAGAGTIIDGFTITHGSNGGVWAGNSVLTLSHNRITGNSGGHGAGVYCQSCISVVIADNLIVGNDGEGAGGGLYLLSTSGVAANNTIAANAAGTQGGGVLCDSSPSLLIANNIVAGNTAQYGGGVYVWLGALPTLSRNCVHGNSASQSGPDYYGVPPGFGDISLDPLFFNQGAGDYHLAWESPCRNAGANERAQNALDLGSDYRIRGGTVDMGAYEFPEGVLYEISLAPSPSPAPSGTQVALSATVTDPLNGPVAYAQVHFSAQGGSVTPSQAMANSSGVAQASVTRSTPGLVTLTVSVYVDRCQAWATKTVSVYFYGPEASSSDWPMFMHDAQHTGMNPESDTAPETLTLAWEAAVPTAGTARTDGTWCVNAVCHPNRAGGYTHIFEHPYIDSSPIVVGNVVVVGTWTRTTSYTNSTGSVKAFDAETGAVKWTATGDPAGSMGGVASTPCFYNGRVFVGSADGCLYCLDIATGGQIWSRQTTNRSTGNSRIISSPVVHDGIVYITNEASKVYAFTADATGSIVDGYPMSLPIGDHGVTDVNQQNICGASSPAVATVQNVDYLLFGCDDGWLYRLRLSDQQVVCANLGACVESSPTVVGDEVFVGATRHGGYQVYRLSLPTLGVLAQRNIDYFVSNPGHECRATLAHAFGHLFVGVDTGWTFHMLTGDTLADLAVPFDSSAEPETGYFVGSAALSTTGVAYVGNDNGCLYALSTTDLSKITSYAPFQVSLDDVVCSSPAIGYNADAGGSRWVYVVSRAGGGTLWAFKTAR